MKKTNNVYILNVDNPEIIRFLKKIDGVNNIESIDDVTVSLKSLLSNTQLPASTVTAMKNATAPRLFVIKEKSKALDELKRVLTKEEKIKYSHDVKRMLPSEIQEYMRKNKNVEMSTNIIGRALTAWNTPQVGNAYCVSIK